VTIRADRLFWEEYVAHVGRVICGCDLLSPDDDCDVGCALFRMGNRKQDQVSSGVYVNEMLDPPRPRAVR
jgi:hypothetical protein